MSIIWLKLFDKIYHDSAMLRLTCTQNQTHDYHCSLISEIVVYSTIFFLIHNLSIFSWRDQLQLARLSNAKKARHEFCRV